MPLAIDIAFVVAGIAVLLVGGDFLVRGAAALANKAGAACCTKTDTCCEKQIPRCWWWLAAAVLLLIVGPWHECAGDGVYGPFFCPLNPDVPEQCRAGMGSHGVVYNGSAYRTLDGAGPASTDSGCQCTHPSTGNFESLSKLPRRYVVWRFDVSLIQMPRKLTQL